MQDIKDFHGLFYSLKTKTEQDNFILKYLSVRVPLRSRARKPNSSRKSVAINYFVKIKETRDFKVQVCQNTFKDILQVSKDRIQRIGRNFSHTGLPVKENRGGSKQKPLYAKKKRL